MYYEDDIFGIKVANAQYLDEYGPEKFYGDSYIEEWISLRRVPATGRVDIGATADKMQISVSIEPMIPFLDGRIKNDSPDVARVNEALLENKRGYVFGHEAGHIFMRRKSGHKGDGNKEEAFCDLFGAAVAIPVIELTAQTYDEAAIVQVMERCHTNIETTLLRLMHTNKLPRKIMLLSRDEELGKAVAHQVCFDCSMEMPCSGEDISSSPETIVLDFSYQNFPMGRLRKCDIGNKNRLARERRREITRQFVAKNFHIAADNRNDLNE